MCRHYLIVLPEHSGLRSAGVSLIYTRTNSKNLANFFSPSQMLFLEVRTTQPHTNTLHKPGQESAFFSKPTLTVPPYIPFFLNILINSTPFQGCCWNHQTVLCFTLLQIQRKVLLKFSDATYWCNNRSCSNARKLSPEVWCSLAACCWLVPRLWDQLRKAWAGNFSSLSDSASVTTTLGCLAESALRRY